MNIPDINALDLAQFLYTSSLSAQRLTNPELRAERLNTLSSVAAWAASALYPQDKVLRELFERSCGFPK